jgi:putative chitinase
MITIAQLQTLCPKTQPAVLIEYVDPINTTGTYYDMFSNIQRIAGFLAQTAHESGGFRIIKENLNYSADGLHKTFPKYFPTLASAESYARQPEKIANKVYANRMMNGDEASGDGFKFRGRGLIQLTGRDNYTKLSESLKMTLDETVTYLETVPGATAGAGWYWDTNKLNVYCDKSDFIGLTKRINGGIIGLADRQAYYDLALSLLQG